jgi:ABC-type glutathione transport system ATPase component
MGISLLCTVTGSRNNDTDKNNALIIDITDRIILITNGQIDEEGTHEDLISQNGNYAALFEIQSKYYRKGEESNEEE